MKVLVSALEHSSNIHLKELKKHLNDEVEFVGIFDKSLGKPHIDLSSLAIMGVVDALKKIKFFFKLANEMVELASSCDKVLLMDSSGFNLPLAKKLKKAYPDLEIIYYILPQAWAWRKGRIKVIEQRTTSQLSILPFEPSYYSKNANITYVGHPLLDEIKEFKKEVSKNNIIAFMPGSRKSEITFMMPIFRELSKKFKEELLLVIPKNFSDQKIKEIYGDISAFSITNDAHNALIKADTAFICSGTATLEAALIGTPFVLGYVAKKFDYFIAKNMLDLKYIGLANIMFDKAFNEQIHPELIQDEAKADNFYKQMMNLDKKSFLQNSKRLREYLKYGSSEKVAKIIQNKDNTSKTY